MDLSFQTYLIYSAKLSLIYLCYLGISYLFMKNVMGKTHYNILKVILIGFLIPFRPSININLFGQGVAQLVEVMPIRMPLEQNNLAPTLPNTALQEIVANKGYNFSINQIWLILLIIWSLGLFFQLLYSIIKYKNFLKTISRWCYVDKSLQQYLEKIKKDMNIHGNIKIYTCTFIETPILYGFFTPTLLIPEILKNDKRVDLYIKHELIHYKRKDIWLKLLAFFVGIIQWFNPVVKHMLKRFELVCEISCDEEINKENSLEEQKLYAKMVLSLAQRKNVNNMVILTQFNGGKNDMEKRIISIMKPKKKRGLFAIIASVSLVILTNSTFGATSPEKLEVYKDVKQGIEISVYDKVVQESMTYIEPEQAGDSATLDELAAQEGIPEKSVTAFIAIKDLTGNRIEEALKGRDIYSFDIVGENFQILTPESNKTYSDKKFPFGGKSRGVLGYNSKTKTIYMFLDETKIDTTKENFKLMINKLTLSNKTIIEGNWEFEIPMPKGNEKIIHYENCTYSGNQRNITTKVFGSNSIIDLSFRKQVISVYLMFKQGEKVKLNDEDILLTYNNGKKITLKNLYTSSTIYGNGIGMSMIKEGYHGDYSANYQPMYEKIDVSQIKSITINGEEININKLNQPNF